MSGLEQRSCLRRRVQIRFVFFRKKNLMAKKQLDWRSRKWAGPALALQLCGEMMVGGRASLGTLSRRDCEIP